MASSKASTSRMYIEDERLASFAPASRLKQAKWPHPDSYSVTPLSLARAGFYYRPVEDADDSATCFMCEKNLGGWEDGDDALAEHLAHSKRACPFARLCALEQARESAGPKWYTKPEYEWLLDIHSAEAVEARLKTFQVPGFTWPHDRKKGWAPTSANLAAAGFTVNFRHASDEIDTASCAYCNRTLATWEKSDDPLEEHRRKHATNPCPFFLFPSTSSLPDRAIESATLAIEMKSKPVKRKKATATKKVTPSSTAATSEAESEAPPPAKAARKGRTRSVANTDDDEAVPAPSHPLRASRRGAATAEPAPSLRASRSASANAMAVDVDIDADAANEEAEKPPVPPPKVARKPRAKKSADEAAAAGPSAKPKSGGAAPGPRLSRVGEEEAVNFEVVVEVHSVRDDLQPRKKVKRPRTAKGESSSAKGRGQAEAEILEDDEEEPKPDKMDVDRPVVQLASPLPTTINGHHSPLRSPSPPAVTAPKALPQITDLISPAEATELVGPWDPTVLTEDERAMTVREWHGYLGERVQERVENRMRADLLRFELQAAAARQRIVEALGEP